MSELKPRELVERLAGQIPNAFHQDLILIGSLAAAYHYEGELEGRAVNTKDADFVVQSVGDCSRARDLATFLLGKEWKWRNRHLKDDAGNPRFGTAVDRTDNLPDVKLFSPTQPDFWIEFQGLADFDQREAVRRDRVEIGGHHFSLPRFRFGRLASYSVRETHVGFRYAHPAMMALWNLLSHPEVGTNTMSSPVGGLELLRSAKDLGRVIAFSVLEGRKNIEAWSAMWRAPLEASFPMTWRELGVRVGDGVRDLIGHRQGLRDATHAISVLGLLAGRPALTADNAKALAEQLLADLLEPFEASIR